MSTEVNCDGIVGPTHHFGGLGLGNPASIAHAKQPSHPKKAAQQALDKAWRLVELGCIEIMLPPAPRPDLHLLTHSLSAAYSASSMWAANSATSSPSTDTRDRKVHLTPANLATSPHRAREHLHYQKLFPRLFPSSRFIHHPALPQDGVLHDEGSANHTRLALSHGKLGVEVFTFGKRGKRYPARQSREACEALIQQHRLRRALVVQQTPEAIDAGVFHNDVIAVGNERTLFTHEKAWVEMEKHIEELDAMLEGKLIRVEIKESELSLEEAVRTYLFNSQLLTLPDSSSLLLAPKECEKLSCMQRLPFDRIEYVDLQESMKNGGGPACLRLRIVLNDGELASVHPGVLLTKELYEKLSAWIAQHYRERLTPEELSDPHLQKEAEEALAALETLLDLPGLYGR